MDAYDMIISLYHTFADNYKWGLKEIEETDFELLLDFAFWKDPNVRVINGKRYTRAKQAPKWL